MTTIISIVIFWLSIFNPQNSQNDSFSLKIDNKIQFIKSSVNTGDFQYVFQYLGVSVKSTKNASNSLNGKIGIIKKFIRIKNQNNGQYETYPIVKVDGFLLNYIVDTKEALSSYEIIVIH